MVSKCANPACSAPLLRLREGKLFQFEVRSISVPCEDPPGSEHGEAPTRQIAHYWLCGPCSERMSLLLEVDSVQVVPLSGEGEEARCSENYYSAAGTH